MSTEHLMRIAKQRFVKLSAELEVQIATVAGGGPTIEIMRVFEERAAESLVALALVDPEDPKKVRALQNEVMKYDEMFMAVKDLIAKGKLYDQELTQQDREELVDYLTETAEGAEQAVELGLIDPTPKDL